MVSRNLQYCLLILFPFLRSFLPGWQGFEDPIPWTQSSRVYAVALNDIGVLPSRRAMLTQGLVMATTSRTMSDETIDLFMDETSSCGDLLVAETAIPGAYQNLCMSLPVRHVPLLGGGSHSPLHILQGSTSGAGSTGAAVWNSSLLLKRLVERMDCFVKPSSSHHPTKTTCSVLEAGCGTGLVSLTLATLDGVDTVTATDGNLEMVQRTASSAKLNRLDKKVATANLQWGILEATDYATDWVVGSDLTYNPGSWPVLAETMATIAQHRVLYLTLAHAGFADELSGFLNVAKAKGLLTVDEEYTRHVRSILMKECVYNADEAKLIQEGRGVSVVVLRPI